MGRGLAKRDGLGGAWGLGWLSGAGQRLIPLLSPRSAADSASRNGDGPGSRAGVPGAAAASALGGCWSPGLGAHDWRPTFPCRGERSAVGGGTK